MPAAAIVALAVVIVAGLAAGPVFFAQATSSPAPTAASSAEPTVIAANVTATATPSPTTPPTSTPLSSPTPTSNPLTPLPTWQMTGYVWPLVNAKITLPFGPSNWGEFVVNGKLFHDGVDMATQCGDKVYAAHDGVVLVASQHYADFIGWNGDLTAYKTLFDEHNWWGTNPVIIVIDDGDGYRSIYAHEWSVKVKPGQVVKAGQVIGIEGDSGHASGCHVHFGLFNPLETATFALEPSEAARLKLPATETARINPLLVLPYRNDLAEMRALRPTDAAAWASAHPSSSPAP